MATLPAETSKNRTQSLFFLCARRFQPSITQPDISVGGLVGIHNYDHLVMPRWMIIWVEKNVGALVFQKNVLKERFFWNGLRTLAGLLIDFGRLMCPFQGLHGHFKGSLWKRHPLPVKQRQKQDIWCRTQPAVLFQVKIVLMLLIRDKGKGNHRLSMWHYNEKVPPWVKASIDMDIACHQLKKCIGFTLYFCFS